MKNTLIYIYMCVLYILYIHTSMTYHMLCHRISYDVDLVCISTSRWASDGQRAEARDEQLGREGHQ